jgi:putative endonuclease
MTTARVRLGKHGEDMAANYLRASGCGILASNYRCPWGEIDLIAQDGQELAFVEVRTRRSTRYGTPQESITSRKAEHLVAAAQDYLQNHASENDWEELPWRIDLVSICLTDGQSSPQIDHIKYAVEA